MKLNLNFLASINQLKNTETKICMWFIVNEGSFSHYVPSTVG